MHPPIMRTALNIGALYGLSSFAFFLLLYYGGFHPLGASSMFGAWLPIVFVIIGIRFYRNKECGGTIGYWLAFRAGFLTIVCGGALAALLLYLFGTVGAPDLVDSYKEEMLQGMEQTESMMRGMFGDKFFDLNVENINKTTLSSIASTDFFNKCLGGAVVSLIAAAFLKRKPTADQIV